MKFFTKIPHPHSFEAKLVRMIWQTEEADIFAVRETILPKGTAEIIFNLSNNTSYYRNCENDINELYQCIINGPNTIPFNLVKNKSQTFVGIQLHPHALNYLLGMPTKLFTNKIVDGFSVSHSLAFLYDAIADTASFEKRTEIIQTWIAEKIVARSKPLKLTALIDHLANRLDGSLSINSISNQMGVSQRHLRRLSNEYLGMNTEQFILYQKYLKSLELLHHTNLPLTEIGYLSGFYDQPNFIREFKSYTTLTPGQYKKVKSGIPGHIYT